MHLLLGILIVLALWYERDVVMQALWPLFDALICLALIVLMAITIVCELALIVIVPIAIYLGVDSRNWHKVVVKVMMLDKWRNKRDEKEKG
jgi:Na+/H+ antiporter NhaA